MLAFYSHTFFQLLVASIVYYFISGQRSLTPTDMIVILLALIFIRLSWIKFVLEAIGGYMALDNEMKLKQAKAFADSVDSILKKTKNFSENTKKGDVTND